MSVAKIKSKKQLGVLLFLLLGICADSWGQYRFEQLSVEDGFSQSIVYQLVQDHFGNIWAATEEGVIRYNAHQTHRYHTQGGLARSFTNRVRTICVDHQGDIWIGGERSVARYDSEADVFVSYTDTLQESPNLIQVIVPDDKGRIWIGAYNGLWSYDTTTRKWTHYSSMRQVESIYYRAEQGIVLVGANNGLFSLQTHNEEATELLPIVPDEGPVTSMLTMGEELLLGTKNGFAYLFNRQTKQRQLLKLDLAGSPIKCLLSRPEGGVYMGTDGGGIWALDTALQVEQVFRDDVNQPHSISSDGIYDLLLDREGLLWVATYGGGLNLLNPTRNQFVHIVHQINSRQGLIHPFTRSILEDDEGNIWFGTKQGISIWDVRSNSWQHLLDRSNIRKGATPIVMGLAEDGLYIWAVTYNNGLFRINKSTRQAIPFPLSDSTAEGKLFSCVKDAAGQIWIGGINRDVQCLHTDGRISTYPVKHVKAMIPAGEEGAWIAGRNGLHRISNGTVKTIPKVAPQTESLPYTMLNCIQQSRDGQLLLGSNGAGLLFYNQDSDEVKVLNERSGLPSDIVQGILIESDTMLWVSTSRGLARVWLGAADTTIQVFDQADGLVSTDFNYGSFAKLRNGAMLFGGVEGVTFFDPKKITDSPITPTIVFEDFQLFNQTQEVGSAVLPRHLNTIEQLKLKHHQNALNISFNGILHTAPEKVKYRWKLVGLSEEWSIPSSSNQTNFTNLAPGDYTFIVQAANRNKNWGPARQLEITISPPWYASTLAYITYALLFAGLFWGAIHLYTLQVNKRNAEQQIAFFNNITHELKTPLAILLSSLENTSKSVKADAKDANRQIKTTIKRLSALFEQLLNFHKATAGAASSRHIKPFSPGQHTKQLLESFGPLLDEQGLKLQLETAAAPAIFYYHTDIFDKVIFNLVSNAIKYSKAGGNITVRLLERQPGTLSLEVQDEGIGIPKDQQKFILTEYYRARNVTNSQLPGTGLGLMMVKQMVEKGGGSIRFTSVENQGTTFFVDLKDREAEYQPSSEPTVNSTAEDQADQVQLADFKDLSVLLVEDNDELRNNLGQQLAPYFKVHTASNGREGLEKAAAVFPDIILTDLIMPEMDGMTMCQQLQEDINLNHIPIIMLTVLQNANQKVESIQLGIHEYMEKPINFELLLAKMTNIFKWRQKMRDRYNQQVEIESAANHKRDRESQFITDLEQFVLEEIAREDFSVQDLCKHLGMSRTSLYMKLKNLTDLSPQDFIIHTRLKYARQMLAEEGAQIQEVAYRCGFSNPKYFSTSFKKKFGQSPRGFRKSLEQ